MSGVVILSGVVLTFKLYIHNACSQVITEILDVKILKICCCHFWHALSVPLDFIHIFSAL